MADQQDFALRLQRIERRRRKLRGPLMSFNMDGILVARPRGASRSISWNGILMALAGFFGLKGLILAHAGPLDYAERLDVLTAGTLVERAGAWMMQIDPLTQWIAGEFSRVGI